MSIYSCTQTGISILVKPLNMIWDPTDSSKLHAGASKRDYLKYYATACGKFLGKTVMIAAGVAITGLALKALSLTLVGSFLGVTAFVATVTSLPLSLSLTAAIVGTIATGILTSYLIEKFV